LLWRGLWQREVERPILRHGRRTVRRRPSARLRQTARRDNCHAPADERENQYQQHDPNVFLDHMCYLQITKKAMTIYIVIA